MVGKYQSLRGDERAGAAAKQQDGVFEARAVRVIDLTGGKPEAVLLHLSPRQFVELVQHPHPLIGSGPGGEEENADKSEGEN